MANHTPVLLQETIEFLLPKKGEVIIDGTLGLGGHAQVLCKATGSDGVLIGIDQDTEALSKAQEKLSGCQVHIYKNNFRNIDSVLEKEGTQTVDKVLLDLGVSSLQLDTAERGFSFKHDAPLDMSMTDKEGAYHLTAYEIINEWDEETLVTILQGYGEEKFAKRIAHAITEARKEKPIKTTHELAELIKQSVPVWYRHKRIHPATKTFQALRIAVNDELEALKEFLPKGWDALKKDGRLAVISFHSLEDRIVKQFFRNKKHGGEGVLINKKPIVPTEDEIHNNPRARSAKLRVIQKL
ncbi:16S rRNA (cytosine(1402)-N(4))-methyltransferase [bacterium]|nr:16S rRNA (cytosine(1402)-N(4))-methyltransferase [bacterium]|tara:strand:+ start:19158 stop:20048 length:891 start_codon:yes stop_codon:yes gene_type:complete